jgi:hypothetical protein
MMVTTAVPEPVAPVKYAFALNVNTSTLFGIKLIVVPFRDAFAVEVALAAESP